MQKPSGTENHTQATQKAGRPLSGPVARSDEHRHALQKAAGEMLSARQVSSLTGLSLQDINEMRDARKLLAVEIEAVVVYPAFQFSKSAIDPIMSEVLNAHKEDHPWVVMDMLLTKDDAFGKSILQLVQDKDHGAITRYIAQVEGDGFS